MGSIYLVKYPMMVALQQVPDAQGSVSGKMDDPLFRHRAVMALFEDSDSANPRAQWNVLFRVEHLPGQPPFFLIQSSVAPVNLPEGAEMISRELPLVPEGTPVAFRIAINAVRRQNRDSGSDPRSNGGIKPVPFDGDEQAPESISRMTPWLQGKLAGGLSDLEIINHRREVLGTSRQGRKTSHRVVQVDKVDGAAIVADSAQLNKLILNGVGRAKSYGCGLLSVRQL